MSAMADSARTTSATTVRRDLVMHSLVFVLGFTLVFILAGASASALGALFSEYRIIIARVFGVVVIVLGLNMVGVFRLPFLAMDTRPHFEKRNISYPGSLLVGIGFAAGWSPCIGPVLAAVLALAANAHSVGLGTAYLLVYSGGLGIPFILTALALNYLLPLLKRFRRYLRAIEIIAGLIVIAMGVVLITNKWLFFVGYLYQTFPAVANLGTGPELAGNVISWGAVFVAGLVSFISPCVLPLVPVYVSYLTGQSIENLVAAYERWPVPAQGS